MKTQKEYRLINNGLLAMIDVLNPALERKNKIKKILSNINGTEYKYEDTITDMFRGLYQTKTSIKTKRI